MQCGIPITAQLAPADIALSYGSVGDIGTFKMPALSVEPGSGVTLTDLAATMEITDEQAHAPWWTPPPAC